MLREILLALSGLPSPIFTDSKVNTSIDHDQLVGLEAHISAPEREMLQALAELAELHAKVKAITFTVCSSHPSPTCRAVSDSIKTKHLQTFTRKVLDVEASILQADTAYVGAYKIVPLSTIVTEFSPWSRPLKWLLKTSQVTQSNCSTARLIDYLQKETLTGYRDIESIASSLLVVAEKTWINCLMPWLLYGQLPHVGKDDFLIQVLAEANADDFCVDSSLVPFFVSADAAEAILAIGKALSYIRSRRWSLPQNTTALDKTHALVSFSLHTIMSLSYPFQRSSFANVIALINDNISETALSHFLPKEMILTLLYVTKEFLLMQNADFSAALIAEADKQSLPQQSAPSTSRVARRRGAFDSYTVGDADLSSILSKTWVDVAPSLSEGDFDYAAMQYAISWLSLQKTSREVPINTLLPSPTILKIQLSTDTPLQMFLTSAEVAQYADISAYLLSVQRARTHVVRLWKIPALRKSPFADRRSDHAATRSSRQPRHEQRDRLIRPHWICASQISFVLSELITYLYGEVIQNSWDQLQSWLGVKEADISSSPRRAARSPRVSPGHSTAKTSVSTIGVAGAGPPTPRKSDPRLLASVHRIYLKTLYASLLLNDMDYLAILRELLNLADHFVALFERLHLLWQSLDLQQDGMPKTSAPGYAKEQRELLDEMQRTGTSVKDSIHDLINAVKAMEIQRDVASMTTEMKGVTLIDGSAHGFQPWRARSLDRLLMRLETLAPPVTEDKFEDALFGADE